MSISPLFRWPNSVNHFITDLHFESLPSGIYEITGLDKNNSDKIITTNFVNFNSLQNGVIIDSTIHTTNGIKPNQQ
uniref:FxLYD domain-containing protein n=1 Tax=Citrobacter freundii TaxID=546 RepID=UPI001C70B2C9